MLLFHCSTSTLTSTTQTYGVIVGCGTHTQMILIALKLGCPLVVNLNRGLECHVQYKVMRGWQLCRGKREKKCKGWKGWRVY